MRNDPSLYYCPETCPAVDTAFAEHEGRLRDEIEKAVGRHLDTLCEKVKDVGTLKLREALRQACDDLAESRQRVAELEGQIETLESRISDLEAVAMRIIEE